MEDSERHSSTEWVDSDDHFYLRIWWELDRVASFQAVRRAAYTPSSDDIEFVVEGDDGRTVVLTVTSAEARAVSAALATLARR